MCGISGIIGYTGKPIAPVLIESSNKLIEHRGPDSSGYFFYKNLALGHQRLSIIDLSDDGKQPMHYKDRYVLTYNGEIYNYIELKAELQTHGYEFTSQTDSEVILASYDYWGKDCVNHFNGMWGFALLDKQHDELFLSRDRFGVKPVYYCSTEEYFAFGSEIKQLLPFLKSKVVEATVLIDYLTVGLEDHLDATFFKGIYKLPPSHSLVFNLVTSNYSISSYFSLPFDDRVHALSEVESVELFRKTFLDSIRIRLRSDVKVGACLSGGLDSSAITHYASKMYNEQTGEKFLAFHVVSSSDPKFSELKFVQDLIKNLPVELVIVDGSSESVLKKMEDVLKVQEEPFGSPSVILQYLLMEKAKSLNCKVLLDGQGGDETLLGYERYYPSIFLSLSGSERFKFLFQVVRKSNLSLKTLISYIIYFTNNSIRVRRIKKKNFFLNTSSLEKLSLGILSQLSENYKDVLKLQKQELFSTQLPHLLRYEDKNSMRFSIETRLPFLDYRNAINGLSINYKYKIKAGWSKYVLRRAIEDEVPESVTWRKNKIGFELPEREIFNTLDKELLSLLENSRIASKFFDIDLLKRRFHEVDTRHKWRVYNVMKWEQLYNVSADES
jgi:asparagine synthase (glutamine-hydrolysing)